MPGTDDLRRLSEELAREPDSMAFLPLAERLAAAGELEAAWRLVARGCRRHPASPDAYAMLARLASERRQWDAALEAWERVASLSAGSARAAHARQEQAFLAFRLDRLAEADRYLDAAAAAGGDAESIGAARARVRERLGDPGGRSLFDELLEPGDLAALLVDAAGRVTAGRCEGADGRDVSAAVAHELAGVGEEAGRAMRHLALGRWQAIVVEAADAVVALAPLGEGLALASTASFTPLGRLRRLLGRVGERAQAWRRAA